MINKKIKSSHDEDRRRAHMTFKEFPSTTTTKYLFN